MGGHTAMHMKNSQTFSKEILRKWIEKKGPEKEPYREAELISRVPIAASTLGRIKSGAHKPSRLLANAILSVINSKEE